MTFHARARQLEPSAATHDTTIAAIGSWGGAQPIENESIVDLAESAAIPARVSP